MDQVPINTVRSTFRIVEELRDSGPLGTSELAEVLGFPTSTVHDHLRTLERKGYVVATDGGYRLGTRFLYVGDRHRRQTRLYNSLGEELQTLASETGEHASVTIEEDGLGVILDHVRGGEAIRFNTYPGMRTKLHLSAAGKAILAFLDPDRVDEIIDNRGLPAMTKSTISTRSALYEELEQIREQQYALDGQESIEGMRGVGVPLLDNDSTVLGAISLYGPRTRIDDDRFTNDLPAHLHESANVIEINYNFNRGGER